jgi:hypothetical protein
MFFGVLGWRYSNRANYRGNNKFMGSIHGATELRISNLWRWFACGSMKSLERNYILFATLIQYDSDREQSIHRHGPPVGGESGLSLRGS